MATGSVAHINAKGDQDGYLTVDPEVTHFKGMFKRHTSYAIQHLQQSFSGSTDWGTEVTLQYIRAGDLVLDMYLEVELDALPVGYSYVNEIGHAMIEKVMVQIGAVDIDTHYGEYMHILNEISSEQGKRLGATIGRFDTEEELRSWSQGQGGNDGKVQVMYIPLKFWFCNNYAQALPSIALQYHMTMFKVKFRNFADLVYRTDEAPILNAGGIDENGKLTTTPRLSAKFTVNNVYLDETERTAFANLEHTYLIQQLQRMNHHRADAGATQSNIKLHFNHPVAEILFYMQSKEAKKAKRFFDFSHSQIKDATERRIDPITGTVAVDADGPIDYDVKYRVHGDPLETAALSFNGHERFRETHALWWRDVVMRRHHNRLPTINTAGPFGPSTEVVNCSDTDTNGLYDNCNDNNYIYSMCFSKTPDDWKPSGSANFSRLDNPQLTLKHKKFDGDQGYNTAKDAGSDITIFVKNYNVFIVKNGVSGIRYSN